MKVKNKTKHFVWKSLNQVLPVNSLIYERDGKGDPWCRCCGEKIETVEHTLLTCRLAQEVWRIAPIQWDDIEDCKHCLWKWWQKLPGARKRKEGDKHIQLTAYILWHIWKNRNQVVFQADKTEAVYLVHRAVNEWMKFEECNSEGNGAIKSETMETIQERENGLEDQTEMNISTSFCIDKINRRIGCCIIAMSHEKQLQFVWAASKKRNADQLIDEANAVKLAMLLAAEKKKKEDQCSDTKQKGGGKTRRRMY